MKNPAVVALLVERLLHKKCHLLAVDQTPLGEKNVFKFFLNVVAVF